MRKGPIPFDLIIDNFGVEYKCHAVVVCAIAPKINEKVRMDDGKRICLEIPDKLGIIGKVIDFCYGQDFIINPGNCESLYLIATRIGAEELAKKAKELIDGIISPANVCQSISFLSHYRLDYSKHVQFIKDNFSEMMTQSSTYHLPISILQEIASSETLCSENEDNIALWVQHVIEARGEEAKSLVDSIHLESVSKDVVLSLCATQPLKSEEIIEKMKKEEKHPKPPRTYRLSEELMTQLLETGKKTSFDGSLETGPHGIIDHIIKNGGNVKIAVSSVNYRYFTASNLLSLDDKHTLWYSKNKPDQWVTYDFSPYLIAPHKYYLRTSGSKYGAGHLKSWVLLGSNDLNKWIEIDKRLNNDELNGGCKEAIFVCSNSSEFFRYIKLQQVGVNFNFDYTMRLSAFECFGDLLTNE